MTPWLLAAIALLPALTVPVVLALRGPVGARLVAVQLASSLSALVLVLLCFAFDQSSSADLGLTLGLLSLPGTLLFTTFLERWL